MTRDSMFTLSAPKAKSKATTPNYATGAEEVADPTLPLASARGDLRCSVLMPLNFLRGGLYGRLVLEGAVGIDREAICDVVET